MSVSGSRKEVLEKVRNALKDAPDLSELTVSVDNTEIYSHNSESLEIQFVQKLQKVDGKFAFCMNNNELIVNIKTLYESKKWDALFCKDTELQDLLLYADIPFSSAEEDFAGMQAGVTFCELLVSRTGSIIVSSNHPSGRRMNVYPPEHLIVAYTSQIVPDIKQGLKLLQKKYEGSLPSLVSVITGPSRTADIEKTLVLGAHGPKEVFVFLVNDIIES